SVRSLFVSRPWLVYRAGALLQATRKLCEHARHRADEVVISGFRACVGAWHETCNGIIDVHRITTLTRLDRLMGWPNLGLSHRPAVTGINGAVASAHPLASLAGLRMLQQGGNAIDAAVATAAALNVVEPYMSGAAGVGYMVIKSAAEGGDKPIVLDYIGRAPAAATPDMFPDEDTKNTGIRSPLVPGALAGWLMALERFGTMDRATVFAPAISYARDGFPVTITNNRFMSASVDRVREWETSRAAYLHDGEAPKAGSILKQPDLARTFEAFVEGGADALYGGPIGKEIARFSQENGGLLTEEDLASYKPEWQEPISTTYRGYTIYCPPLPFSGMQYFQTLN